MYTSSRLPWYLSRSTSQLGYPDPQFDICCHLVPVRCPYIENDITTTLYYAPVDDQKSPQSTEVMSTTMPPHHAGTQARSLTASLRCLFSMSHLLQEYPTARQRAAAAVRMCTSTSRQYNHRHPVSDPGSKLRHPPRLRIRNSILRRTRRNASEHDPRRRHRHVSPLPPQTCPHVVRLTCLAYQHEADMRDDTMLSTVPILVFLCSARSPSRSRDQRSGDFQSDPPMHTAEKEHLAAEGVFGWLRVARSLGPSPSARSGLCQGKATGTQTGQRGREKGPARNAGCGMWEFPWNPYDIDLAAHQPPGPLFPPVLQQKPCL